MITIGYSTKKIDPDFREYIEKSCGLKDVQVIPFENPGTHSLTEAYNIILEQSENDIVVLCHDDIQLKTNRWGKKIIEHFKKTDYGIIGVAGTYNFSNTGRWWEDNTAMVGIVNHKNPQTNKEYESRYSATVGDNIIPVVSLDGVFMVLKKSKLKRRFDETIKGFHFYDVDFTVSNYIDDVKVGVITNIRILHYSVGMTNEEWEKNRLRFVDKWSSKLPLTHPDTEIFKMENTIKIKQNPKVSIIILSKSSNELLFQCIDSIIEMSSYNNYEIIVGDTGSNNEEIEEFNNRYSHSNIKLIKLNQYHFATNNNEIVKNHTDLETELILFCNNDIKLINDAISEMVSYYVKNKNIVGTMGARLHYKDKSIQHSGITLFMNNLGQVGLSHFGINTRYNYFENNKEVFGNTAALMLINKNLFINSGMFNTSYSECFEDVDLNNEVLIRNKKNILVGNAVAYHYESQTRKKSDFKLQRERDDIFKVIPKLVTNKNSHKYIRRI